MTERRRALDRRITRALKRMYAGLVIVAVGNLVGLAWNWDLAGENRQRVRDINHERARNIRVACEAVNDRHTQATRVARRNFPDARVRTTVVRLLDAAVPARDCDRLVAEQVRRP